MAFWLTALVPAALVAVVLIVTLLRGRAGDAPPAAYDLQVYRDQLKEVEKDLARGILTPEDAERTRIEVSRRVLEADRKMQEGAAADRAPKPMSIAAGVLTTVVLVGGALALYAQIGAPGYRDLPLEARKEAADELRQTRPRQAEAEADMPATPPLPDADPRHVEMVEKLREVVAQRPDDIQGQKLLARNEAALGNFRAAYEAQARMIALKGDQATAEDFANLTDAMVLAAGGYVSPEAEAAIDAALTRDGANGIARYYLGLLYAQTGRPDIAFRVWRGLLESSAPDDPWIAPVRAGLPELAMRAGVEYQLPPMPEGGLRGPSAADMEAAADMTPEERQQFVRNMVEQLNDRLATQGGTAAEWAQLIGALGNLGEAERAAAIWGEAQTVFAGRPGDLAQIRAAAESAGVADAAPALRGPTAEDMQNAASMTPEERQAMIANMVEGLAERLAEEGGSPAEWAQLIGALANLGQTERAAAIWGEAQTVFAAAPDDLARIRAAAEAAGVAE